MISNQYNIFNHNQLKKWVGGNYKKSEFCEQNFRNLKLFNKDLKGIWLSFAKNKTSAFMKTNES